jgi:hypothetical protein
MKELTVAQGHAELASLLSRIGLQSSDGMVAVHLAEVEEEAGRLLDLLLEFRAWARQGETELAEKRLAEVYASLLHLSDHAQAAVPLLETQLELDQDNETQGQAIT